MTQPELQSDALVNSQPPEAQSPEQAYPTSKTNEQVLLTLLDKVIDKFGSKKSDILEVLSGIKNNRKNIQSKK